MVAQSVTVKVCDFEWAHEVLHVGVILDLGPGFNESGEKMIPD